MKWEPVLERTPDAMAGENQSRKRHRRTQRPIVQSPGKAHSKRGRSLFGHAGRLSNARSPTERTGTSRRGKTASVASRTTGDCGNGERPELVVLPKTPVAPILSAWSSTAPSLGDVGFRSTLENAVATLQVDSHAATTTRDPAQTTHQDNISVYHVTAPCLSIIPSVPRKSTVTERSRAPVISHGAATFSVLSSENETRIFLATHPRGGATGPPGFHLSAAQVDIS